MNVDRLAAISCRPTRTDLGEEGEGEGVRGTGKEGE